MTQEKDMLYRNRSSTRQFLFCKTDSVVQDDKTAHKSFVGLSGMLKVFPELLIGKSFIEPAMVMLSSFSRFGAMIIRIDNFSCQENSAETLIDVARIIDDICRNENGIWGQLDHDTFGCFFPEKNDEYCLEIGESIKAQIAQIRVETASIGVAGYPLSVFEKSQILDNARKALDHAAFFGPGHIKSFDAVSLNISGDKLYQDGNIHGAIEEFKLAIKLDPANANVHNSLGICYRILGQLDQAIQEFETAENIDPAEVMPVYNTGLIYLLKGDKRKALALFLKADGIGEEVFEIAFQTGRLYLELGQPEKGAEFFKKAIKLRPESALTFRYLGKTYATLNKTNDAINAYKKAVKYNPYDAASLSALGYLFDIQGENLEISTVFCQHSVSISPDNGLFRHRLGRLYLKQNRLDDALDEFRKASKLGYDSTQYIKKIKSRQTAKAS